METVGSLKFNSTIHFGKEVMRCSGEHITGISLNHEQIGSIEGGEVFRLG
jgi:hypothetical protein